MHLSRAGCLILAMLVGLGVADMNTRAIAYDLKKSLDQCNGKKDPTPDEVIRGCTVVIQYGRANVAFLRNGYLNRAMAYLEKGDEDRALADLTEAIGLNTPHAEAHFNRGTIYLRKEDWDRAIADFNAALEMDPVLAEAFYNRAVAYQGKGDLIHAEADRAQALKLKPELANE